MTCKEKSTTKLYLKMWLVLFTFPYWIYREWQKLTNYEKQEIIGMIICLLGIFLAAGALMMSHPIYGEPLLPAFACILIAVFGLVILLPIGAITFMKEDDC